MTAYKIVDNKAQRGDFLNGIPAGFTPYTVGQEPQELIDALAYKEPEQKMNDITVAIQTHLDEQAQALRYDNMTSARAYAGYLNAFVVEATELAEWCAECWTYAGVVENDVMNGLREIPTPEEAIAELPLFRPVV